MDISSLLQSISEALKSGFPIIAVIITIALALFKDQGGNRPFLDAVKGVLSKILETIKKPNASSGQPNTVYTVNQADPMMSFVGLYEQCLECGNDELAGNLESLSIEFLRLRKARILQAKQEQQDKSDNDQVMKKIADALQAIQSRQSS